MSGLGRPLRSGLFLVLIYAAMAVMGVVGAPVVLWREDWTRAWMKTYNRVFVFPLARALCGVRVEVRGPVPSGDALVIAKHQSLLDVLILWNALPEPRFVMKRELLWTPVFGLFARRAGAVPIDRSGGSGTVGRMVEAFRGVHGQVAIYPQGTRVAPGATAPYKRGAVRLYEALDLPAHLVATNAGHVWPRRGSLSGPGTAVVWFFETLPSGLAPDEAAAAIEARIEAASERLSAETPAVSAPRSSG